MDNQDSAHDPPQDYEALIRLIHERFDRMSKTYQSIAVYLTQNPNEVAIQSVTAIGARLGIHASSFVRFAQALGYNGFKELQNLFQKRLATAAPGFEARVKVLQSELHSRKDHSESGFLRDLVIKDIASLEKLLEEISQPDLAVAVDTIVEARTVYLLGQLRSAPVVDLLRYVLTMVGKRCVLLDPGGGLATHMARLIGSGDVLVAVSFRFTRRRSSTSSRKQESAVYRLLRSPTAPYHRSPNTLMSSFLYQNTITPSHVRLPHRCASRKRWSSQLRRDFNPVTQPRASQ